MNSRNRPPASPIPALTPGRPTSAPTPAASRKISGNSTTPWPVAIHAPAWRDLAAAAKVAAVTGPGAMTPESEMATTVRRKPNKTIASHLASHVPRERPNPPV